MRKKVFECVGRKCVQEVESVNLGCIHCIKKILVNLDEKQKKLVNDILLGKQ